MDVIKAHGTGNDFVVVADLADEVTLSAPLVRALTDRRFGIGGDGVIRIGAATDGADGFMDYRNADGSVVEMCGNGVRVVAKHLLDHGHVPSDRDEVVVATRAGHKPVQVVARHPDGRVAEVAVDMGTPVTDPAQVPFTAAEKDAPTHPFHIDGRDLDLAVVSMGNPHAVLQVDDVTDAPVTTLGPRIDADPRFPAGVNVGFAQVVDRDQTRLRVWERGVGETAACGTGACAAVVGLQRLGALDTEVQVHLPGGRLTIHHDDGPVTMTGPAVEVGQVTLDHAWLTAAADDGKE